jgi:hypothetical protein
MQQPTTQPSRYQVAVRGRLGEHLADAFEHLQLDTRADTSLLSGTFADQSQLHGLLDHLHDLGVELVSVKPIN